MKKILPVFFTLAVIFTFAGCSNTAANNRYTSSERSAVSKNNSIDELIGTRYLTPFIVYGVWQMSNEQLEQSAKDYVAYALNYEIEKLAVR
jgi:putative NADPH-quinone reductase